MIIFIFLITAFFALFTCKIYGGLLNSIFFKNKFSRNGTIELLLGLSCLTFIIFFLNLFLNIAFKTDTYILVIAYFICFIGICVSFRKHVRFLKILNNKFFYYFLVSIIFSLLPISLNLIKINPGFQPGVFDSDFYFSLLNYRFLDNHVHYDDYYLLQVNSLVSFVFNYPFYIFLNSENGYFVICVFYIFTTIFYSTIFLYILDAFIKKLIDKKEGKIIWYTVLLFSVIYFFSSFTTWNDLNSNNWLIVNFFSQMHLANRFYFSAFGFVLILAILERNKLGWVGFNLISLTFLFYSVSFIYIFIFLQGYYLCYFFKKSSLNFFILFFNISLIFFLSFRAIHGEWVNLYNNYINDLLPFINIVLLFLTFVFFWFLNLFIKKIMLFLKDNKFDLTIWLIFLFCNLILNILSWNKIKPHNSMWLPIMSTLIFLFLSAYVFYLWKKTTFFLLHKNLASILSLIFLTYLLIYVAVLILNGFVLDAQYFFVNVYFRYFDSINVEKTNLFFVSIAFVHIVYLINNKIKIWKLSQLVFLPKLIIFAVFINSSCFSLLNNYNPIIKANNNLLKVSDELEKEQQKFYSNFNLKEINKKLVNLNPVEMRFDAWYVIHVDNQSNQFSQELNQDVVVMLHELNPKWINAEFDNLYPYSEDENFVKSKFQDFVDKFSKTGLNINNFIFCVYQKENLYKFLSYLNFSNDNKFVLYKSYNDSNVFWFKKS